MNISEKRIETQVQFWSLLGPGIILLAVVVLLVQASAQWYLPLSVLVGVPLCVKWKLKGLASAVAFLFVLFLYSFPDLNLDERYWHVGMGMAMAFSFVILTLSVEEVTSLVGRLQAESQSRLENYQSLDSQVKELENEWSIEKEGLYLRVNEQTKELTVAVDERQTLQKLVYLAKDELIALRNQHEKLLQDLFFKRQEIAQLHERVEESEVMIQSFVNTDSEQRVQQLIGQLTEAETEIERLKSRAIEDESVQDLLNKKEAEMAHVQNQKVHFEQIIEQQEEILKQQREHFNLQIKEAITNLNQTIEKTEQEKRVLSDRLQHIEEQFVSAKQHSRELSHSVMQVQELRESVEKKHVYIRELEDRLTILGRQLADKHAEWQRMHQANEILKPQVDGFQKALQQIHHQNEEKHERIQALSEHKIHLERELHQKTDELQLKMDEIHRLQHDQEALRSHSKLANDRVVNQLNSLQEALEQSHKHVLEKELQIEAFKKQIQIFEEESSKNRHLPHASGNTRRIEGMYIQLREQFEEKSTVLDQTRRELFHAQEQLTALYRSIDESSIELTDTERLLQKELNDLINDAEETQQEVDILSKLVGDLLLKPK